MIAALGLIGIKLAVGLTTGSLGFVSDAIHSVSDFAAAGLTFLALGVARRPADRTHPYGHAKAEHLAALGEAVILGGASLFIVIEATSRLVSDSHPTVETPWWAFAALAVIIGVDLSRASVSHVVGRRHQSPALAANAYHFVSDAAGSVAVLIGLIAASAGYPGGDSIAALVVAAIVITAAGRLLWRNADILMDRASRDVHQAAEAAVAGLAPSVALKRLRMREVAGRHFADVVVTVAPEVAVTRGHALADEVERAVEEAVPGSDVVVHVEPEAVDAPLRERIVGVALELPGVREVHNVEIIRAGRGAEISLHLRLPGDLPLAEAHDVASRVESEIEARVPEVTRVETHLEPLAADARETAPTSAGAGERIRAALVRELGEEPRSVRLVGTDDGIVVFLTVRLHSATPLADAHERATRLEQLVRETEPTVSSVVVHTEP